MKLPPTISSHMSKFTEETKETILGNPDQAQEDWDKWFVPFFDTTEENPDVVKAVRYINCYGLSNEMWKVTHPSRVLMQDFRLVK